MAGLEAIPGPHLVEPPAVDERSEQQALMIVLESVEAAIEILPHGSAWRPTLVRVRTALRRAVGLSRLRAIGAQEGA